MLAYAIFMGFFIANFMMLGLQSVALRLFVLVTKVRMYILAGVILAYCGIGVFALHNVEFDMWTLFWFGIIGYIMRNLGFPLAPMILGVVLGRIAELQLARAMAISTDITPFLTQPWSLFFLTLAVFSMFFPNYQRSRGRKQWTVFYVPALALALSVPLFMMGDVARPVLGGILVVIAAWLLWKASRRGFKPNPEDADQTAYMEG